MPSPASDGRRRRFVVAALISVLVAGAAAIAVFTRNGARPDALSAVNDPATPTDPLRSPAAAAPAVPAARNPIDATARLAVTGEVRFDDGAPVGAGECTIEYDGGQARGSIVDGAYRVELRTRAQRVVVHVAGAAFAPVTAPRECTWTESTARVPPIEVRRALQVELRLEAEAEVLARLRAAGCEEIRAEVFAIDDAAGAKPNPLMTATPLARHAFALPDVDEDCSVAHRSSVAPLPRVRVAWQCWFEAMPLPLHLARHELDAVEHSVTSVCRLDASAMFHGKVLLLSGAPARRALVSLRIDDGRHLTVRAGGDGSFVALGEGSATALGNARLGKHHAEPTRVRRGEPSVLTIPLAAMLKVRVTRGAVPVPRYSLRTSPFPSREPDGEPRQSHVQPWLVSTEDGTSEWPYEPIRAGTACYVYVPGEREFRHVPRDEMRADGSAHAIDLDAAERAQCSVAVRFACEGDPAANPCVVLSQAQAYGKPLHTYSLSGRKGSAVREWRAAGLFAGVYEFQAYSGGGVRGTGTIELRPDREATIVVGR